MPGPHTTFARLLPFVLLSLLIGCTPATRRPETDPAAPAAAATPIQPLLIGTSGRPLPEPPLPVEMLRLAILPDRTAGRPWGMPYLARAAADLERTRPDAIFTVGDMVQGYTRNLERFREEAADYLNVVGSLGIPFYPTPGNHDIISGTRRPGDETFVPLYEELFGPRYYAVDFGLALVICLSTEDLAASGEDPIFNRDQLAFLDRALTYGVAHERPMFVLMHRPAWRERGSNYLDAVHPRLAAAGVEAVIAGHFHSLQREADLDGVEYHLLSVCGGMIDQHPLTGQLNHLTYLNVAPSGDFNIYHAPVGHTLPDDWVLREDQDRAFRVKSRSAEQFSPLPQPLGGAVSGSASVAVRNPIDRPITLTAALVQDVPAPMLVEGEWFCSTTERDIYSPHNTHAETPFRMVGGSGTVVLQPDEERELFVELESPPQPGMSPPPEVHLVATFEDSQGRAVPVVVRRRVPLTMAVDLSAGETGSLLLWAWEASVYDNDEPPPTLTLARSGEDLYIALYVPDNIVEANADQLDDRTRVHNPLEDSVVVRVGDKRYLIDPFAPESEGQVFEIVEHERNTLLMPTQRVISAARRTPDGYGLRAVVRDVELPTRLNVEVADNDETYHTQWRQLAPPWLEPVGIEVR